jgi:Domain of unknown function (DUF4157)
MNATRQCAHKPHQTVDTAPKTTPRSAQQTAPERIVGLQRSAGNRAVTGLLGRPGSALDPALRESLSSRFGADLGDVRVHTDPDAAASAVRLRAHAYTVGHDIVFGPGRFSPHTNDGRRLLAHELAHVVQQGSGPGPGAGSRVSGPSDRLEAEAERAADTALAGGRPHLTVGSANGFGVMRQAVVPADPFAVLDTATPLTAADAKSLLDSYEALSPADRDTFVRKHHAIGVTNSGLTRLLAAVDKSELKTRRALVSDIAERVQRIAVEQTTGKTLGELGAAQGAFMRAEAEKRARATAAEEAKKTGATPPATVAPAKIAEEHAKETKRTSPVIATVTNAWTALAAVPGAQAAWNARAAAVITNVVDACKRVAPELGISAANLAWKPEEIAQAGSNVFASAGDPIHFGMSFVETAEADPDYVVRVVIHEIAGHPEFGSRFGSYEAKIYAEAHAKEPVLGSPWDTPEEVNTFGYIGTETYAALREVPFEKRLSPTHAAKGLHMAIDPASNVDNKIGLIKSKYAPGVAEGVVQGLYERFRIDPRISAEALELFEEKADKYFPDVLKGVPKRGPTWSFEPAVGAGVERAGGRTLAFTSVEANVVARWANTALSGGLRLELPLDDKEKFVRLGVQSGLHQRLFKSLYGELHGGYAWGVSGGASSGLTVGAGLSYDFGPAQLGLVYDYLKAADEKDPDAHRAFLRLGARF